MGNIRRYEEVTRWHKQHMTKA